MAREDYSRDFRSIDKGEALRKALAPALRPASVTQRRTKYDGPVKNRGEDARGNANVSREELADFQRQYGADKTLRDLLNADATGKLPARVGAGAGRGAAEGRKATDRDTAPMRSESPYNDPSRAKEGAAARRREMMRDPGRDAVEPMLGPEAGVAALGRAGLAALARGAAGAMKRPAAKEASERNDPSLYPDPPKTGGVFSSARYGTRGEQQAAGRKATEDYARDVMERGAEMGMKRGGNVKSYAKGGSVRGAGCETRTKKTRYV